VAAAQPAVRPLSEAVVVEGATDCLDRGALVRRIARWLRSETVDARIAVVVRKEGDGDVVGFVIRRDGVALAERRFDEPPEDCNDLRAALGLAIALAIDATILESLGTREQPPHPPPPAAERPAPPPPRPPPDDRPQTGLALAAEAQGSAGILPAPAVGVATAIEVRPASFFSIRAGAVGTFPVRTTVGDGAVDVSHVAGGALACFANDRGRLELRLCLGAAAGQVLAQGSDFDRSLGADILWVAAEGRLEGRWRLVRPLAIAVAVSGFVPLVRPRLDVERTDGSVSSSRLFPAWGGALALGPVLYFR